MIEFDYRPNNAYQAIPYALLETYRRANGNPDTSNIVMRALIDKGVPGAVHTYLRVCDYSRRSFSPKQIQALAGDPRSPRELAADHKNIAKAVAGIAEGLIIIGGGRRLIIAAQNQTYLPVGFFGWISGAWGSWI